VGLTEAFSIPVIVNIQGVPQAENVPGMIVLPASPPSDANPDQQPPPTAGMETNPAADTVKAEPHVIDVLPPVPVVTLPPVPVTPPVLEMPPVPVTPPVWLPPVPEMMPPLPVTPPVCVPPVPVTPPVWVPPVPVELLPPVLPVVEPPVPVLPETVSPLAQE